MYFLGGEREFIKPDNIDESICKQIIFCFKYLSNICSVDQVYKLNFFVQSLDSEDYHRLQTFISDKTDEFLGREVLLNVIAQSPLTRKVVLEVFTFDPVLWKSKIINASLGKSILFEKGKTSFLIGSVQVNGKQECGEQSEKCFFTISEILQSQKFSIGDIIRQWNYIENIIGFNGNTQNYQSFNNIRSIYYGNFFGKNGYPAATGIGMNEGGVIIEFIAMQSAEATSFPVDNPGQIAAHNYSESVLIGQSCDKTTPKFERARYLKCRNRQMMFISGTASITGEKTIGIANPKEQTRTTIENIKRLYSEENLKQNKIEHKSVLFNHCRVYIRNTEDFIAIEETCLKYFGDIPMVFIKADICRNDLLVEIEGELIL